MSSPETDLASRISQVALQKFASLPNRGKPNPNEWAVLASFVAEEMGPSPTRLTVVSLATGNKCCGPAHIAPPLGGGGGGAAGSAGTPRGYVLHDSHAEVLAKRGLTLALLREAEARCRGAAGGAAATLSLLSGSGSTPPFEIRADIRLHLFVSESPCGSASIYPCRSIEEGGEVTLKFTGAKAVAATGDAKADVATVGDFYHVPPSSSGANADNVAICDSAVPSVPPSSSSATAATLLPTLAPSLSLLRELGVSSQSTSSLRLKSGHSLIPASHRSLSHCCSDKIVRWCSLGLLGCSGGALPLLLRSFPRVVLSSVVVCLDPQAASLTGQEAALAAAICPRVSSCLAALQPPAEANDPLVPTVRVVPTPFPNAKRSDRTSPSGVCINYNMWDEKSGKGGNSFTELTIAATGLRQKTKAKKAGARRTEAPGGTEYAEDKLQPDAKRPRFVGGSAAEAEAEAEAKDNERAAGSRLCRRALLEAVTRCCEAAGIDPWQKKTKGGEGGGEGGGGGESTRPKTYQELKNMHRTESDCEARSKILCKGGGEDSAAATPLSGWVLGTELFDFDLEK